MSNVPQYSLPGLVHYLQSEWTHNEKDRIQWANEREEMKAMISKLQSENDRLKRQLLEQNGGIKAKKEVTAAADDIETTSNVDALVKAREHLQTRMDEVLYLLRGSNGNDLLGVRDYVTIGSIRKDNSGSVFLPKRTGSKRSSPNQLETFEIDSEKIEKEFQKDIESDNETISGVDIDSIDEKPLEDSENFPEIEDKEEKTDETLDKIDEIDLPTQKLNIKE